MSKYDYEYEYDPVYCYPGSDVLRNKMDIRDQDRLSKIEGTFLSSRQPN